MKYPDGFFWKKIIKAKPEPPVKFWLEENYLPKFELKPYEYLTDKELVACKANNDLFVCDAEVYTNCFCVCFLSVQTNKVVEFKLSNDYKINFKKLNWILTNFTLIGFNIINYDKPILTYLIQNKARLDLPQKLKQISNQIIDDGVTAYNIYKNYKLKYYHMDVIDVQNLCPVTNSYIKKADGIKKLPPSLKKIAARLGCYTIQELPFPPDKILTKEQFDVLVPYCVNDCINTKLIYDRLFDKIQLREEMGKEYDLDLRSKSDAQMTEAVFKKVLNYEHVERHDLEQTQFKYKKPPFIRFKNNDLLNLANRVEDLIFNVSHTGHLIAPVELTKYSFQIKNLVLTMGIGGLHSVDEPTILHPIKGKRYIDVDVKSFYPYLWINQKMKPKDIGAGFLPLYSGFGANRIKYKNEMKTLIDGTHEYKNLNNKVETFKIFLNGAFGKTAERFSCFYDPGIFLRITLTGQLALLMMIEAFVNKGIKIISVNTDGILTCIDDDQYEVFHKITTAWEKFINFELEETEYKAFYSRDVNNYFAVKLDGKLKRKGIFNKGSFDKNQSNFICNEAVVNYITKNIPIETSIKSSKCIEDFITLRNVTGGAVWHDTYLGNTIRFYHSKTSSQTIVYANNGNKVPLSENTKPIQTLTDCFDDIDYDWYVREANKLLTLLIVD